MGTTDEIAREQAPYYIQATTAPALDKSRILKYGETFGVFDQYGDLDAEEYGEQGIFHRGTRFLSRLKLKLLESRPLLLSSTVRRDNVLLAVDLTNPDVFSEGRLLLARGTLHIYRSQFLWNDTLYMHVNIHNFSLAPVEISFLIEFGADFSDIFEVRGEKREHRGVLFDPHFDPEKRNLVLSYEGLDQVLRQTRITTSPSVQAILPSTLHFTVRLDPGAEQCAECSFAFGTDSQPSVTAGYADNLALATGVLDKSDRLPAVLSTSNEQFDNWVERSRSDLNMLLTEVRSGIIPMPACPGSVRPLVGTESLPPLNVFGLLRTWRGECCRI